jgi:hypothetical protein
MSWRDKRKRLERLERSQPSNSIRVERLLRILAGDVKPTPAEELYLINHQRQHELKYDPPDCIERKLARLIAKAEGRPDPYGTDGLSEAERRAWDWADYRGQERERCEELDEEEGRLPIGLRELRASDTLGKGNREREQGQVA